MTEVLVVDDDPIVLESCRRILEPEGFAVTLASCAEEALAALEKRSFGLLLLDVIMPESNGISLIRALRSRGALLPILVMSGHPTSEIVAEGERAGATAFIAKPFTPDELLAAVRATAKESP